MLLGDNLTMRPPSSSTLQKRPSYNIEYTWTLNRKESLLICFENYQDVLYSHKQSRNRIINTFIVVNIAPKRIFFGPKQNILWHSFERTAYLFVLKAMRVFPVPHTQRVDRGCTINTLLTATVFNPIFKS